MKERTIVSALTLLGSLTAYYYAKQQSKDPAPVVMIGGFVGALVGEVISQVALNNKGTETISQQPQLKNKNNDNTNQ